tara:strand:- start:5688 stop:7226 length:1539 start_codon:yes stop_codon:yes gene_type:complete
MSITIPTSVSEAWDDLVKRGLSTDEYSYLVFDVTKTETDSTKKVQVFMKVYVPEEKRHTATVNVMKAMQEEGYTIEQRKSKGSNIPEIDIQVGQSGTKIQVIRVQFKPVKSSGSGGGSKQTTVQESTSCLYNALRFHVIKKKLTPDLTITTDHLDEAAKWIETPGATVDQMILFSNQDPDWKEVFIDGANKLYDKVQSHSNTKNDYIFVRGDKDIDDGVVKKSFAQCKSSLVHSELKNEDKWNPSDIWMYSKGAKTKIENTLTPYGVKKTSTTIEVLNDELINLFNDGILMGVSLKKTGASGTVKVVNNETPAQRKANLGVAFDKSASVNDVIYDNGRNYADKDKKYPMDIYVIYGSGAFDKIQLRNFGGNSKGDWKLELKGQYAAMGKIQGSVARFILGHTGFTNIPQEPDWKHCHPKTATKAQKEEITKEIYDLLSDFDAQGFNKQKKAEKSMMGEIASKRQSWRYSKLSGLRFLKYLCKSNVDADKAVKELYLFGGSASDHSSIYYKYS